MQGDEVGGRQQLVELDQSDALDRRRDTGGGEVGIVSHDLHAQAAAALRHDAADAPQADHSQALASQLAAHQVLLVPLALAHLPVGARDVPGEGAEQGDRQLPGGRRVARRRVHDDHPALGGSVAVDVVHADPRPTDHAQGSRRFEHAARDARGGAHDQSVDLSDACAELVLAHPGLHARFEAALTEGLEGGG